MPTNKNLLPQQCKNIVENFMVIVLLLKKSMISLRGTNVILYNKIAKIIDYD